VCGSAERCFGEPGVVADEIGRCRGEVVFQGDLGQAQVAGAGCQRRGSPGAWSLDPGPDLAGSCSRCATGRWSPSTRACWAASWTGRGRSDSWRPDRVAPLVRLVLVGHAWGVGGVELDHDRFCAALGARARADVGGALRTVGLAGLPVDGERRTS